MKKKLIVATVLILLLALSLTMLVGCDEIFKKNDERDAKQVVATVNYNGQSANIYKFELMASFNQYAYAYNSYYGMTYEQAADYILQSLAQQKLLVLYAMEKVPTLGKFETAPKTLEEMLSNSERNKAVENANDSLYSALSSLIKDSIAEDNYNSGSATTTEPDDDDDEEEITDAVYIRYESNGGSSVERERIQKGTTVKEPTEPTKEGYTFYGWYEDNDVAKTEVVSEGAWHFRDKVLKADKTGYEDLGTPVNESKTLYAKWVKYVAPRSEKPEVEEEDDYDPDDVTVEISAKFFTDEYKTKLFDKVAEEDYVETMKVKNDDFKKTLQGYIDDALATLEKNLKNNLYKSSKEECYEYYLKTQMETLLVTKLERLLGESATVTQEEVEKEFNRVVAANKETFLGSNASYSSALTSMLDGTYYHNSTEDSYGFVINILLKLDEEKVNELTAYLKNHPGMTAAATIMRNRMLSEMEISVSNPEYDSKAVVKDKDNNEIELRDPMTDPANPYNGKGKTFDTSYQKEDGNDYEKLVSFEQVDGKYTIVYGASEHPAMPYLLEKVPAFDKDGKTGIIHQMQNSFAQVKAATDLSATQKVYWMREVATAWLYLVGDDTGAVSSDSNNGGLGYLVSPEGETSGYLEAFTDYARALIKAGTGSFRVGEENEKSYLGAETDGTLNGDGVVYVAADSFIETGNTGNAYAGIFVLVNSYTVWDSSFYDEYAEGDKKLEGNTLPLDYLLNFAQDEDDMKTVYQMIEETLLAAKRKNVYNLDVNTVGNENMDGIVYYKKAYKSLWKDLD